MKLFNLKRHFRQQLLSLTAGALLGVTTLLPLPASAAAQLLDRIIAVVDDDVVMASELSQRMNMVKAQLAANNTPMPDEETLKSQILDQLINEALQLQLGQRVGVTISDDELDETMQRMKAANNLTDQQFAAKLAVDGISYDMFREQIRRDMIIDQVQKGSVYRRINITDQEIESFLKSKQGRFWSSPDYDLGHILIAVPSSASTEVIEQSREKAQSILNRLKDGADFRQLAVAESQGQNALQGGDLGWRKANQLPEIFAEAITPLKEGDTSELIRSGAGFHILKVYGMRGDQDKVIEQAKARHILIKPSAILTEEQARDKLADIRQKILDGASFNDMAKEYSEDVGSMLSGGDLGWSLPGKFVPEFEKVLEETPVGEISEPFRSQFGWHIIQVDDRRQQDMSDTVRFNQAAQLLRNRRFDEERINWLQEIRDQAYIKVLDSQT